ncbi:F-box domain-containing protein [Dioscorea alata]|uniref:F-box domain-containing protein n=1 Tax=Dioscorea alata TaxID=55571 RepID=A0ACB7W4W1_DIOAL|nr:F-box domain-containing protein [Dioscorea alata]
MEGETPWESHTVSFQFNQPAEDEPFTEINARNNEETLVSLEAIIPDDILEKVFSFMPIACVVRLASVCWRWYRVVHSISSWTSMLPQKPWYFMFTSSDSIDGHAYDPSLRKWYSITLPCHVKSNWISSASGGLVSFMENEKSCEICIFNPLVKGCRILQGPPAAHNPDYSAIAMSVNQKSNSYTLAVAKSKQIPGDYLQWDFSIDIYESENCSWVTSIKEVLMGWRGGDESVICNGVFYCLIYATGIVGASEWRHGLIAHDLSARTHCSSLLSMAIPVPCSLTCGRLMNLKDKLVMVGGIGKQDRPDIIKGIGIWELCKKEWREVARMPHKFFQGFGELDDVFASCGMEDLIYIQSYGAPALLVYDISQKQWRWSVKCPVPKRFPLQLFTGFCFEPRIEAVA